MPPFEHRFTPPALCKHQFVSLSDEFRVRLSQPAGNDRWLDCCQLTKEPPDGPSVEVSTLVSRLDDDSHPVPWWTAFSRCSGPSVSAAPSTWLRYWAYAAVM